MPTLRSRNVSLAAAPSSTVKKSANKPEDEVISLSELKPSKRAAKSTTKKQAKAQKAAGEELSKVQLFLDDSSLKRKLHTASPVPKSETKGTADKKPKATSDEPVVSADARAEELTPKKLELEVDTPTLGSAEAGKSSESSKKRRRKKNRLSGLTPEAVKGAAESELKVSTPNKEQSQTVAPTPIEDSPVAGLVVNKSAKKSPAGSQTPKSSKKSQPGNNTPTPPKKSPSPVPTPKPETTAVTPVPAVKTAAATVETPVAVAGTPASAAKVPAGVVAAETPAAELIPKAVEANPETEELTPTDNHVGLEEATSPEVAVIPVSAAKSASKEKKGSSVKVQAPVLSPAPISSPSGSKTPENSPAAPPKSAPVTPASNGKEISLKKVEKLLSKVARSTGKYLAQPNLDNVQAESESKGDEVVAVASEDNATTDLTEAAAPADVEVQVAVVESAPNADNQNLEKKVRQKPRRPRRNRKLSHSEPKVAGNDVKARNPKKATVSKKEDAAVTATDPKASEGRKRRKRKVDTAAKGEKNTAAEESVKVTVKNGEKETAAEGRGQRKRRKRGKAIAGNPSEKAVEGDVLKE